MHVQYQYSPCMLVKEIMETCTFAWKFKKIRTVLLLTGSVVTMHNEIKILFPLIRVKLGAIEYDDIYGETAYSLFMVHNSNQVSFESD